MRKIDKLKKLIATIGVTVFVMGGTITPIYADDVAAKLTGFDYYYITDESNLGQTLKMDRDGNLDEADAYSKLGKNYIDDMETWSEMALYDYGVTLEQRSVAKAKVVELANSLNYGSTYDKYKRIFDYMVANVPYDYSFSKNAHNVYGCLVNHSAVCQGYAKAYKAIADCMGLPCYMRTSNAQNHAWNAILLDGEWYVCDVTAKSFAEAPGKWRVNYYNEESSGLNSHIATSSLNVYAPITYASHGYGTSNNTSSEPATETEIEAEEKEEYAVENSVVEENVSKEDSTQYADETLENTNNETPEEDVTKTEETKQTDSASTEDKSIVAIDVPAVNNQTDKADNPTKEEKEVKENHSIPLAAIISIICIVLMFIGYIVIRIRRKLTNKMCSESREKSKRKF